MTSEDPFSQFPMSDWDMYQMEPAPGVQMSVVDDIHNHRQSDHSSGANQKTVFVEQTFGNPLLNPIRSLNNGMGYGDFSGISTGSSANWVPIQPSNNQGTIILNNTTGGTPLFPVKRKAEMGNVRKPGPALSNPDSPRSLAQSSNAKKLARNDSSLGKSGLQRGQPVKKQTTQIASTSKNPRDSSEAVRSKMRESLASALDLALQKTDSVSNNEKKYPDAGTSQQPTLDSQTSESNLQTGEQVSGSESVDMLKNQELVAMGTDENSQVFPSENPANEISENEGHPFQEFHYLPDVDVSFSDNLFVKDDLLQGNGLSWAFDFDMQMRDGKVTENSGKLLPSQSTTEEIDGKTNKPVVTSEDLAFKIEAELFKLHGGVNKKYKEKGRSLLFNLKDPNNPELRERVISGEIPPDRLCSMSAEELASKELSEWRMAKAEELAQMVVLPDTEVDVRRLVRKTHKGEYQVEFDHDESIVADVSAGTSMLTQLVRNQKTEAPPPKESDAVTENASFQENSSENKDVTDSLINPTDGTDLMHGMSVDEMKDAEFLPPIVSLDEFMESLNTEPPFEDLSADSGQRTPSTKEESIKAKSQSTDRALDSTKDASTKKLVKKHTADMASKVSRSHVKHKVPPSPASKFDYVWEGNLLLNISSSVTVGGLFLSGEKTPTREWPVSLEIKGRVRLDAFEKFIKELPMSRTRAVMVLQFVLKNKASELERSNLSEAIDSYSADDRLGYAEPASGVELYLCPPTARIVEILNKNIAKERLEIENSAESGLIGAIVWRRAHVSRNMISPNSSYSLQKHSFKRQQQLPSSPSPRAVKNSPRVNIATATTHKSASAHTSTRVSSRPAPGPEDDDDDIPPGFGPQAPKEDDDLPEFSFSRTSTNPSLSKGPSQNLHLGSTQMTERSKDHVRELIQKYGKSSNTDMTTSSRTWEDNRGGLGGGIEPWNDDDDDIPEWRPQQVQQHGPPGHAGLVANQYPGQVVTQQLPSGLVQPHPSGGQWAQTPPHGGARWRQQ